jgi:hypothetical protein
MTVDRPEEPAGSIPGIYGTERPTILVGRETTFLCFFLWNIETAGFS